MQTLLVMTVIGPDRPGLVESVAALVAEHGGNWLESSMSRLGGQFAGILRVEAPSDREAALKRALEQLSARGLHVVVHQDQPIQPGGGRISVVEVVGHDRPGIVRQISSTLAAQGVNVEELQTERSSAAMSGEEIFKARAKLRIPESVDPGEVRTKLEKIAEDLIVDISFS
jgi:glycine cleavage system regulatory protein